MKIKQEKKDEKKKKIYEKEKWFGNTGEELKKK